MSICDDIYSSIEKLAVFLLDKVKKIGLYLNQAPARHQMCFRRLQAGKVIMTKHHAKQKKHHAAESEAGFLSFSPKEFMNKSNSALALVIVLGIIVLLGFSAYMILNNSSEEKKLALNITPTPAKVVTTPYPTIPQTIKDTTILVNARAINPLSAEIVVGGTVGFFNEDSSPVEIRGYDVGSSILNVGFIEPYDAPFVKFEKSGVYKFINPQNPEEVGEIRVK